MTFTLKNDGPVPWLFSLRGPKDEAVNEVIRAIPGVSWDRAGLRWLVPFGMRLTVQAAIPNQEWSVIDFPSPAPRIWARRSTPPLELLKDKLVIIEAEKFANPNSKRTQALVEELEKGDREPFFQTSLDMYSNMQKAFNILELAFPGRFGRWPERYGGSWRFLDRYADWEENRFGRLWKGPCLEHREEYLMRLRCCAWIDEPPFAEEPPMVEAKGLFE